MSQDSGNPAPTAATAPIAVVTGASSGTGRDIALALAADGCDVALLGRRVDALKAVKDQIEAMGRRACVLMTDLLDEHAIAASMETFLSGRHVAWTSWSMPPAFPVRWARRWVRLHWPISMP